MIHEQNTRCFEVLATLATSATTADVIDRNDSTNDIMYDYTKIRVSLIKATAATTASAWASLVIQESDDSTTGWAAISTGGTDFTIPAHVDTANPSVVEFQIPGGGRKRYYKVVATPGAAGATTYHIAATFSRGTQSPNTDSERGADEVVFVT